MTYRDETEARVASLHERVDRLCRQIDTLQTEVKDKSSFKSFLAGWSWDGESVALHVLVGTVLFGLFCVTSIGVYALYKTATADTRVKYCYLDSIDDKAKPVALVGYRPWTHNVIVGTFSTSVEAILVAHVAGCPLK